jgi:hypothetical protein
MSNYLTADARAPGEASSGGMPLSSLYHEIGLAAVATELNLQLNALEPAEAVEMGTAALLLAGDAPGLTHHRRSVRVGAGGGRHKVRRYLASKARQSRRFPTGKSVIAK